MNTSINEYYLACSDASYDVYAFTETWLNSNTLSQQLFGFPYTVYRSDRSVENSTKTTGGGVLLAINSKFISRELLPPDGCTVEQIWVAVSFYSHTTYIGIAYIPPDRINDSTVIDSHISSLNWITNRMSLTDNILLLGDFNLSGIRWTQSTSKHLYLYSSRSSMNCLTERLLDSFSVAGLCQMNGILNDNNRMLDLCFTNSEMVHNTTVIKAPSALVKICRHHPPLLVSLIETSPLVFIETIESTYYNYRKANFSSMNRFFTSINWDDILIDSDIEVATQSLSNVILYAIDRFVPKKTACNSRYPPWSNHLLKRLKRVKRSTLRKFSNLRCAFWKARYSEINKDYKKLNRALFGAHLDRVQSNLKKNPQEFWRFVDVQRKESGLPTIMTRNNVDASNKISICELFREQFSSVFVSERLHNEQIYEAASSVPCLPAICINPAISSSKVQLACLDLKRSSNPGPDGIPSIVLKKCSSILSSPLSLLFSRSLRCGVFPKAWKNSFVYPVFKKGSKKDVKNYRGIACLCSISKLFEIIVLDFISHACSSYISDQQHGFVPRRSTSTNLVLYTSFIARSLQSRNQIDAVYTDFSAAFDKINHDIVVAKLQRLGFHSFLLNWLHSYLTDRVMSVKIGDTVSSPFRVTSGVPQGSHLGPYIFLLYLNDINLCLKCPKLAYADDFKLFYTVNSVDDAIFLQQQLDIFSDWCETNRMVLNPAKCSVISFTRKRSPVTFSYKIRNISLKRVVTIKDLGIVLDSKLTFNDHISYITTKASRMLGFIFRITKQFKDPHCIKALYCALVRSHLEYACIVWSPYYQNSVQRIEVIQRKFVRFALRNLPWSDPSNLPSYEDRCKLIGLDLLSVRRDVAKATFISDLISSKIDCADLLQSIDFNIRPRNLRSHTFLCLPHSRTNYGYNEPVSSMSRVFNRCYLSYDFHLSRASLRKAFLTALSS